MNGRAGVMSSEGLDKLFFELASESRLGVLHELQVKNLKMQELARKLDLTDTETCRQLQRLSEAHLIQKQVDGTYVLTTYAKLVLDTSASLGFIYKFREYFLNHNVCLLPLQFRARLVELSGAMLLTTAIDTFNTNTEMLRNAREKIDATIEVGLGNQLEIMKQRIAEGVKVRWLLQESYLPKARDVLGSFKKFPEMRHTAWLWGHLYQTENGANLQLRQNDGTQDYVSFHGKDPSFLQWANDFFTYEWEKAKPWHP